MRIGIDARVSRHTGIREYVRNLIKNLRKIDRSNQYVIFLNTEDFPDYSLEHSGFKHRIISSKAFTISEQVEIPFFARLERLDIYHSPHFLLPLLNSCRNVVTIHDLIPKFFSEELSSFMAKIYYDFMLKAAMKNAAKILTVSDCTKKDLIEIFDIPDRKIKVTYEAAGDKYRPIDNEDLLNRVKKKFNISEDFVLYVGLQKPHKNLVRLIEAFKILLGDSKIKVQLLIVGKKDTKSSTVSRTIERLNLKDSICLTDYVPEEDLPLIYNAALAFVFPSLYEGFGLCPLEAMACGTPVISSNFASLKEVLGDAALIFNPLDIRDMADKMRQIITDEALRKQLKQKGLRRASEFSWRQCALETLDAYKELGAA